MNLVKEKNGTQPAKDLPINPVKGFSKLSKLEKIDFLVENYFANSESAKNMFKTFWNSDEKIQKTIDEFSENTLTNFVLPLGVVPNVLINNKLYAIPMVIEESSVVAASAKAANFWLSRGGFKTEILGTKKIGQVHFIWIGDTKKLQNLFDLKKSELLESVSDITMNMNKRGGGILDLRLVDRTLDEAGYYQILGEFDTRDAMGANFINSILEAIAAKWKTLVMNAEAFSDAEKEVQIVMSILSNYTPECRVRSSVECDMSDLYEAGLGMSAEDFALKFTRAVRIAKIDVTRATTHNKGIFNGIDAVVLATGNDFRAVEACGHAYAARDGQYRGLSEAKIEDGKFKFSLEIPLAIGSVGGLTSLHPMAKLSLDMLGRPDAATLMQIIATIGLAQNFGAVRSLVTSGIQKGHMKMHLMNILNHLEANAEEIEKAKTHFENEVISFKAVREFIASLRNYV
ncbi:MAG: hydroxymethylglutaryl-CoA reductase, degradative [Bdellovibrionales bacterium]|nr:hydroxymethylglutaryl-CoA reductase, degradative [Bdellovibrionales bacterium]